MKLLKFVQSYLKFPHFLFVLGVVLIIGSSYIIRISHASHAVGITSTKKPQATKETGKSIAVAGIAAKSVKTTPIPQNNKPAISTIKSASQPTQNSQSSSNTGNSSPTQSQSTVPNSAQASLLSPTPIPTSVPGISNVINTPTPTATPVPGNIVVTANNSSSNVQQSNSANVSSNNSSACAGLKQQMNDLSNQLSSITQTGLQQQQQFGWSQAQLDEYVANVEAGKMVAILNQENSVTSQMHTDGCL